MATGNVQRVVGCSPDVLAAEPPPEHSADVRTHPQRVGEGLGHFRVDVSRVTPRTDGWKGGEGKPGEHGEDERCRPWSNGVTFGVYAVHCWPFPRKRTLFTRK